MPPKIRGFPVEDDIVLCQVTKIYPNSVFVDLVEFERRSGIIHISEVSPGRIRNLRDYVSVGRQIVCKILRVNQERGHIDLSLRRVNSTTRRQKLESVKQERKAEQLLKNVSKKLEMGVAKLYSEVSKPVLKEYEHLFEAFMDVAAGEADLGKLGVKKELAKEVTQAVIDKFKPKKIEIEAEIIIKSYAGDGVERIKKTLLEVEKVSETISVNYLGAGRYKLRVEDFEYKPAEKNVAKVVKILEKFNDKLSSASFERAKAE